jgi:hypothetical protein
MSDFDDEIIVSAETLAKVLDTTRERIDELTRLGILRPIRSDDPGAPPRYGFLATTQAYLRHYRNQIDKEN